MKIPKRITLKLLQELQACYAQRERFREMFPRGVTITEVNCEKALAVGLDLIWLANQFFTGNKYCDLWDSWVYRYIEEVELFMSCYRLSQKRSKKT